MSMFFSSNQERDIHLLKQQKMKHILRYNIQEMERKRKTKQQQSEFIKNNSRHLEQQALNSLISQNQKRQHKIHQQRNMLKETYERQMKEREEKKLMERAMDRQYFQRQQQYMDYEESRRMMELARIYNRATYEASPLEYYSRKRIQTEADSSDKRPYGSVVKTPQQKYREPHSLDAKVNSSLAEGHTHWKPSSPRIKDSLDNLNAEHIRYPQHESRKDERL